MDTTEIIKLSLKGDGVDADGRTFPRSLPGEQLRMDGGVLTPSVHRVKAPCRHFKSCGGCALQHASDAFVEDWKTEVIRLGLAARGIETDIRPILTSPAQSRRRATLHGKRTKKGAMCGFHTARSDALIEIPDCQLLHPAIMAGMPAFDALTQFGASRKSEISLVVTSSAAGLDIDVRGAKAVEAQDLAVLAGLADTHDLARLTWDGEQIVTRRAPYQTFGTATVTPPPGAFLQATEHGQETLIDCVSEALGAPKRVVDLFAGCGTFTLPTAQIAEVAAFEGDEAPIEALTTGWRQATGLKRVHADTRDLFRRPLLADEFKGFDAAIIDPPRAGAEAQTIELAASGVSIIAAVSCNPVTFARDARILIDAGFVLDWIQPVDQFRWSTHVELAAKFSKPHIKRQQR